MFRVMPTIHRHFLKIRSGFPDSGTQVLDWHSRQSDFVCTNSLFLSGKRDLLCAQAEKDKIPRENPQFSRLARGFFALVVHQIRAAWQVPSRNAAGPTGKASGRPKCGS
jgi:hypothetical protein